MAKKKLALPKIPRMPPVISKAAVVVVLIFLAISAAGAWSDFTWNGNPFTWFQAHDAYLEGVRRLRVFDLEPARKSLKEAIATYPNDWKFWKALGECYWRLKAYKDAEEAYKQSVKLNRSDIESWRALGRTLAVEGKIEEAEQAIRTALEIAPKDAAANAQLGLLMASKGDLAIADRMFVDSRDLDRSSPEYWCLYGKYCRLLGRHEEATAAFKQSVAYGPLEPEYREWLGLHLLDLGQLEEAERNLRKAAETNTDNADYWVALAHAERLLQRYDDSVISIGKALKLDPDSREIHREQGLLLTEMKRWADAESELSRVIDSSGNDPEVRAAYVNVLAAQGKLEQLEKRLLDSLSNSDRKHDANDWLYYGNVLLANGKTPEAKTAVLKAFTLQPSQEVEAEARELLHSIDQQASPILPESPKPAGNSQKR